MAGLRTLVFYASMLSLVGCSYKNPYAYDDTRTELNYENSVSNYPVVSREPGVYSYHGLYELNNPSQLMSEYNLETDDFTKQNIASKVNEVTRKQFTQEQRNQFSEEQRNQFPEELGNQETYGESWFDFLAPVYEDAPSTTRHTNHSKKKTKSANKNDADEETSSADEKVDVLKDKSFGLSIDASQWYSGVLQPENILIHITQNSLNFLAACIGWLWLIHIYERTPNNGRRRRRAADMFEYEETPEEEMWNINYDVDSIAVVLRTLANTASQYSSTRDEL